MRRLNNVTHSVRFRLTVWYGFLMVAFMVLAGLAAWTLMSSWLRADLDDQLKASAQTYSDPGNLTSLLRESAEVDPSSADGPSGGYRSLIVQTAEDAGSFAITPFNCAIPYGMPADAAPGTTRLSTQSACGDTFRVLAVSAAVANRQTGNLNTLVLAQSMTPIDETLSTLRELLLAIGALGVLLALQGGWLIAGRALRPISSVTETASTIAESPRTDRSLAGRLPIPPGDDEVAQLTSTFNRMLDRIEAEFGRRQRFVADASHELRTPLAAIRGNLDVLTMQLRRVAASPEGNGAGRQAAIADGIDDLTCEAARMARLLDDLLFLARADDAHGGALSAVGPVRLDDLARDTARAAGGLVHGQTLSVDAPTPVTVAGDRDRLAQVLWVLLDNALRHTDAGHAVTVRVAVDGPQAALIVADEGTGIAPDDLPHVFDRFFRADEARGRASGGSGLGLAIAQTIAEQHGGTITAESSPGAGSAFTVRLPLAPAVPVMASSVSTVGEDGSRPVATAV